MAFAGHLGHEYLLVHIHALRTVLDENRTDNRVGYLGDGLHDIGDQCRPLQRVVPCVGHQQACLETNEILFVPLDVGPDLLCRMRTAE